MDTLGSPSSPSAKKGKLFKLIKWNAVAFRNSENHIDGDCAICYSHLNGLCTDCKVKDGHIKDCPLSQGNMFPCGHIFHSHCIERWIKENGTCTCPESRSELMKVQLIQDAMQHSTTTIGTLGIGCGRAYA